MNQIEKVINYNETFLSAKEANELFDHLMQYKELNTMMEIDTADTTFKFDFGKMMFIDKNLQEKNKFPESIWGKNVIWSKKMLLLKKRIEDYTNDKFKTCVCIFYPDGNSGVAYHSDEMAFGDTSIIPSVSLGEERLFSFREKASKKEYSMPLKHGSLLIMGKGCQENFEHSLPENIIYKKPRISLTFRKFGFD